MVAMVQERYELIAYQKMIKRELSTPSPQPINKNLTYPFQTFPIKVKHIQNHHNLCLSRSVNHHMQSLAIEQSLSLQSDHPPNYN